MKIPVAASETNRSPRGRSENACSPDLTADVYLCEGSVADPSMGKSTELDES